MDFTPDAAAREVADDARRFADRVLRPAAAELDRRGGFPRAALGEAAAAGLLGINVPAALGGREAGVVAYALSVMELAAACAATTVAICVNNMVAEVVTAFGAEEQRREHVPRLCDGRHVVGAFALSEPGAGSDPGAMLTRARPTDGGWVIEGSKLWITSGSDAGLFVVWARTDEGRGARGISAFLVPGDTPGLERGRPERKMGLHGSTTTPIELHGCEVPAGALLGNRGEGFRVAMMALDGGRIGIASQALGIAGAAIEAARRFAATPGPGGGRPGADQGIQWLLADAATELDAARLLILRAAWLKQQGRPFSIEASTAKLFATERAVLACDRAIEVMGREGYTGRHPVERCFRDVKVTTIYEGTSEVQRIVIARDIVRRFAGEG